MYGSGKKKLAQRDWDSGECRTLRSLGTTGKKEKVNYEVLPECKNKSLTLNHARNILTIVYCVHSFKHSFEIRNSKSEMNP